MPPRALLLVLACVAAPYLVARLHPLLGAATRPLVYLLAAAQVLALPVAVWLDPDISYGSDTYSLDAGFVMVLLTGIEMIVVAATAGGLLAATSYLRRGER